MKEKTALIAGSSGLIGSELLHLLLAAKEYDKVIAIVRSPLNINHSKLVEKQVDFEKLADYKNIFLNVNDVFSCLGTTIKKAKTKEAMFKVDVEYPLSIAKLARQAGANQFLFVSSLNANQNSPIWYSKIKGTLEQEIIKIPYHSIAILRPSLLLGKRKEFRLGEKFAGIVSSGTSFLFIGPLARYKAIKGETVALAMYRIAQANKKGISFYPSEKIASIANNLPINR